MEERGEEYGGIVEGVQCGNVDNFMVKLLQYVERYFTEKIKKL